MTISKGCRFDFVVFDWNKTLEPCYNTLRQKSLTKLTEYHANEFCKAYKQEKRKVKSCLDLADMYDKGKAVANAFVSVGIDFDEEIYSAFNMKSMAPGAFELLCKLQESGVPIGLVRNSTLPPHHFHAQSLEPTSAHEFFDVSKNVILSGEVGVKKPDPQIFEALLSKAGMRHCHENNPKNIVFIGNDVEADVKGGRNMGWTTVLIRSTESSSNGLADFECDTFQQLEEFLFGSSDGEHREHSRDGLCMSFKNEPGSPRIR